MTERGSKRAGRSGRMPAMDEINEPVEIFLQWEPGRGMRDGWHYKVQSFLKRTSVLHFGYLEGLDIEQREEARDRLLERFPGCVVITED